MESGYYWFYTVLDDGVHLESENYPSILKYHKDTDTVFLFGYDVEVEYTPEKFKVLGRIDYKQADYTPIETATALSLYGCNVSPEERAERLYDYFTKLGLPCADSEDLLKICVRHTYAATEFDYLTALVYVEHALARYGKRARVRCSMNRNYLPPEFLLAIHQKGSA